MKTRNTARDIMIENIVMVTPEVDVHDAAMILLKKKISSVPVVDEEGRFLGEFSGQSCMDALLDAVYEEMPNNRVGTYIRKWGESLHQNESLISMVEKFQRSPQRVLPVILKGKLVGIVTRSRIIRTVVEFLKVAPDDRKAQLLYLSALRGFHDPPEFLI